MKHWIVETPKYEYEEWIDGWILADRYPVKDFVYVESETRKEAIRKGVAKLREDSKKYRRRDYYGWYWDKSSNPFTGVKAKRSLCDHGYCYCDEPTLTHNEGVQDIEECSICMAEGDAVYEEAVGNG